MNTLYLSLFHIKVYTNFPVSIKFPSDSGHLHFRYIEGSKKAGDIEQILIVDIVYTLT
jgi:hypothetical protein